MKEPVIEHTYTSEIVCPYCGHKFRDSWEFQSMSDEIQCSKCEKDFLYERDVTVTYSTSKINP